jgi:aspartate/tyrosine/aromatic aminotransferase
VKELTGVSWKELVEGYREEEWFTFVEIAYPP